MNPQYNAWDKLRERMMSVQSVDFFWGLVYFQLFEKQKDGSFIHRTWNYDGVGSESIEHVELLQLTGLPEKTMKICSTKILYDGLIPKE